MKIHVVDSTVDNVQLFILSNCQRYVNHGYPIFSEDRSRDRINLHSARTSLIRLSISVMGLYTILYRGRLLTTNFNLS